ncbi:hypothetical protein V8E36_007437 [Tilletia maclaganii]
MAAGADAGSFNPLWFLLLIPLILFAIGLVVAVWLFIARRHNSRRRQSMLRNVPVIQAEAEAEIEKMERRASARSKRSLSLTGNNRSRNSHRHSQSISASKDERDTLSRQDRASLEKNLTRSLSTRSQREVYARTLKARALACEGGNPVSVQQLHPTPFRLNSASSAGHGDARRPLTPELEEGRATFSRSQGVAAQQGGDEDEIASESAAHQDASAAASDDSHATSSSAAKRHHHNAFRRGDANELSVIGEISESVITPSASGGSRLALSPSTVLASAALAAEPDSYTQSPVDPTKSPFRDPEVTGHNRHPGSTSTTGNTTGSSTQNTADERLTSPIATVSSETSASADEHVVTPPNKLAAPVFTAVRTSHDDDDDATSRDSNRNGDNKTESSGRTPTLTPRPGPGGQGGSPSEGLNATTPTVDRTPSPATLEREAQDRVEGLGVGAAAGTTTTAGGGAGKFLAPLLPNFLRSSHDGDRSATSLGAASSDADHSGDIGDSRMNAEGVAEGVKTTDTIAPLGLAGSANRSAPSPVSPVNATSSGALFSSTGAAPTTTTTKPRASMSSLRSALHAPALAPAMMPSRSATGGSTGGNAHTGGGATSAAPAVPGGSAWTYTSRASEWKTASSASVGRTSTPLGHHAALAGGGGGIADRRASTTSLASSRGDGHERSRPGMPRRTSHGVAGSMYREHFGGGEGEEDVDDDDHSSRISHMLDEDERRQGELERQSSVSSRTGAVSSKAAGGGGGGFAAALMRKTSSKSGRSSRAGRTLSPTAI